MLTSFKKQNITYLILLTVLFLILTTSLFATQSPWWDQLQVGPHAVGFRTIEKYDYSRSFLPGTDYFGNELENETARPIQICIWYPAKSLENPITMVYGEYVFPAPNDNRFFNFVSDMQQRELGLTFGLLANNQALVFDAMNTPLNGIRDAKTADGTFPVVIVYPDYRGGYCQNIILFEFLASYGFVVITSHSVGTTTLNITGSAADMETQIRDREFSFATVADLPFIDKTKVATLGMSSGSLAALIHQMRNNNIDAVISLNGAFISDGLTDSLIQNIFYDPSHMTVPLLNLYTSEGGTLNLSILDSLTFSSRYSYNILKANPLDFTHYNIMSQAAGTSDSTQESAFQTLHVISSYTLNFLKAHFKKDEQAKMFMNSSPEKNEFASEQISATFLASENPPPTSEQFLDIIQNYGVTKAAELCDEFDLCNPTHPIMDGPSFTRLGYQFLQRGETENALIILKWGTHAYPNSANAWDSYGEVCMSSGDNELALENYKKALEILPADSTINPALRTAIQDNVPGIIERLEQEIQENKEN